MKSEGELQKSVLIRADGGERIGLGHVIRNVAIAEVLRERGFEVVWLGRVEPDSLRSGLEGLGVRYEWLQAAAGSEDDLLMTQRKLSELGKAYGSRPWLLMDGPDFGPRQLRRAREFDIPIAFVDDTARHPEYPVDVIVNPNGGAERLTYNCPPETVLLLGSRFALLRREIRSGQEEARQHPPRARCVLVTMGGADPPDVTSKVLQGLNGVGGHPLEIVVVVGPANARGPSIERLAAESPHQVTVRRSPPDFAAISASADLAITAAGGTAWELAFLGTPMLTIQVARDQAGVADRLVEVGAAIDLGWHEAVDPRHIAVAAESLVDDQERRRSLGEASRSLIDGRGAERVADILSVASDHRAPMRDVRIRSAQWDDRFEIWRMANDPAVRQSSFSSERIPLDQHLRWFDSKLHRTDSAFLVMEFAGVILAHARYERADDTAEVHFAVSAAFRGRGLGTRVLRDTLPNACRMLDVPRVFGTVLEGNVASVRAFLAAGYQKQWDGLIRGRQCHRFEVTCETKRFV